MNYLKAMLTFFLLSLTVFAQKDLGETITMESEVMGETRELQIVLPENFSKEKSYTVVYVTDGEKRTTYVKSIVDFIKYAKMMPESIVVGIINVDRTRDFTPTKNQVRPVSGNAATFIQYLEKEVKPYIIKNYGTNHKHVLTGHSLGGLLSMYTLLTKPDLFDSYVASDPSFWWDNEYINNLAKEKLPSLKGKSSVLFINGREGQPMDQMGINNMKSILETYAPDTLDWKVVSYPNETHTSVVLKGYYDGLRFIEEGFVEKGITFHPRNINYVKGKPFMMFLYGNIGGVHYTLDGKEPTKESTLYKQPILIENEGVLKFKRPTNRNKNKKAKEIAIKSTSPIKGETFAKGKLKKGLKYKYNRGVSNNSSKFKNSKTLKKGIMESSFGLKELPEETPLSVEYKGYYEAKTTGYYYFGLSGDATAQVLMAKQVLLNYNKEVDGKLDASALVFLEKGFHPLTIKYQHHKGKKKIKFNVYIPDVSKGGPENISFDSFYHK